MYNLSQSWVNESESESDESDGNGDGEQSKSAYGQCGKQLYTVSLVTMATQQVKRQTDRSKGQGIKPRDKAN